MKEVIAFGDWHGNTKFATEALHNTLKTHPDARLVHCGDFGFWETNILSVDYKVENEYSDVFIVPSKPEHFTGYVHEINTVLEHYGQTLYVVLGNHENYDVLPQVYGYDGATVETEEYTIPTPIGDIPYKKENYCTGLHTPDPLNMDEEGFITSDIFPNIKIVPRAHTWCWDGVHYASLGGATSIDIHMRYPGMSWWIQELITDKEVSAFHNLVHNTKVDIMFTHDAPQSALSYNNDYLGEELKEWVEKTPSALQKAVDMCHPKHVVCGHHHRREDIQISDHTMVHILDCDGKHEKAQEKNTISVTDLLQ